MTMAAGLPIDMAGRRLRRLPLGANRPAGWIGRQIFFGATGEERVLRAVIRAVDRTRAGLAEEGQLSFHVSDEAFVIFLGLHSAPPIA
jgi:hypothetical protein